MKWSDLSRSQKAVIICFGLCCLGHVICFAGFIFHLF